MYNDGCLSLSYRAYVCIQCGAPERNFNSIGLAFGWYSMPLVYTRVIYILFQSAGNELQCEDGQSFGLGLLA